MEKKVRWSDLSVKEQTQFGKDRGCGPGAAFMLVPQFIFMASCHQHDFYYSRGGDIVDKFEADVMFLAYMLKDINEKHDRWYKKLFHTAMAKLYFLWVSLFGCIFFRWGEYRSKKDILKS